MHDPTLARLSEDLKRIVGPGGEVRFGDHDRALYSTDASLYQVMPLGVVVPGSVDGAAEVVRVCARAGVAMLPRGGGTSLAGQCTNRAVVLDMTPRCRAIRSVDLANRTCEVEPGITIEDLNDDLGRRGASLFFAPDPATMRQCAVGGAIGNNAAGARSVLYGRTSENVQRIEVVLSTGERLWLGPGAGRDGPVTRRLAAGVIEIVNANARLIRERFPRTVRRNAGYGLDMMLDQIERGATAETLDLAKLLCGSEGTLAVTLGAVLNLHPVAKVKGLGLIAFDSVDAAIDAVLPILATKPSAVELLDDVVLEAARGNEECREYLSVMPHAAGSSADAAAILYVEYFAWGMDGVAPAAELAQRFAAMRDALRGRVSAESIREAADAATMAKAWALRKAGEPLLHGMPGKRKPITFVEDNAVPPERLGEFVRKFREIITRHGTRAAYWAHASVGVLHVRPMIDLHDPADRERVRAIAVEVADLARSCGGIMSGEHGDGRVRGPLLERFFGPELMGAFAEVKRVFDPAGLLNPSNIVGAGDVASITERLRVDAGHRQQAQRDAPPGDGLSSVSTYFDYSDSDGFGHAVEQCNGAGVCRKRGGVMCPSFQGTLDERHSTRGRGNALRLAITGQFGRGIGVPADADSGIGCPADARGASPRPELPGGPDWSDPETIKTLDLCLSCKACKSECPSNVDIARLKAEYTAQRYRRDGRVPLGALVTGHIRILNTLGAFAPDLANWFNTTRPARAVINRLMTMHQKRTMPRFSPSLYRLASKRASRARSGVTHATTPDPRTTSVIVFTDCFTTYNESHIGLAAINILGSLGYNVSLSGSHCCGRSMISVGMLAPAIEAIDRAVESLRPAIEDDSVRAIIVCEPSCLSAIKDDWLALNCRTDKRLRERLAAKAMLPEDFIESRWNTHPTPFPTSDIRHPTSDILFHAHCHQKALWGADSSARLLRRLAGDRVKVLDAGCCGMAGSFGFGRDKYDLSMKIGELSLLPRVRAAGPDDVVVATGTSCRHQIHDGARRHAVHPIELAARLMGV